jgi:hypothetical protein
VGPHRRRRGVAGRAGRVDGPVQAVPRADPLRPGHPASASRRSGR